MGKNQGQGPLCYARGKETKSRAALQRWQERIKIKGYFATLAGYTQDQGPLCYTQGNNQDQERLRSREDNRDLRHSKIFEELALLANIFIASKVTRASLTNSTISSTFPGTKKKGTPLITQARHQHLKKEHGQEGMNKIINERLECCTHHLHRQNHCCKDHRRGCC